MVCAAHLDDAERALVLGAVLDELPSRIRTLPRSRRLRALVVFDEVYRFRPRRSCPRPS